MFAAGDARSGEDFAAGVVGGAPHPVRAVHGPAAVLQGHGAGRRMDVEAGGNVLMQA